MKLQDHAEVNIVRTRDDDRNPRIEQKAYQDSRRREEGEAAWDAGGARRCAGFRRTEGADVCATLVADRVGGDGIVLDGGKRVE